MNLRRYIMLAAAAISLSAAAQQINPITQAMLDGYEQLLSANPNDYFTLYERAAQYYRLSRYDLALNDVKKAISCTPPKDKAQLVSEYSLCADIYIQLKEYQEALEAVNAGLKLEPNNYPMLYMKGNICLYLNDLEGAKQQFQAMARVNSRSQESLFGLAKVAVLQNNYGMAEEYIKQAERLDPANYVTYCRIGDLHLDMKQNRQAAADYISAYSLSSSNDRAISSLMQLAQVDYDSAMAAVDYALSQTGNTVPLYFLKGNISLNSGRYADAYEAYRHLIDAAGTDSKTLATLAPSMARICLGQGNLQEADKYANIALTAAPSAQNNYLKALIEEANGNYPSALIYARNAARGSDNTAYLTELASLLIANDDPEEALLVMNDALLTNPFDASLILMRAIAAAKSAGNSLPSPSDALRATTGDVATDYDRILKAIALQWAGMHLDAQQVLAPILANAQSDAKAAYYASIFYNCCGEPTEALKFKNKADELGMEDEYVLTYSVNPLISLRNVTDK